MNSLYSFYSASNDEEFNGIFYKIQTITNKNPISDSIIHLSCSSYDEEYPLTNIYNSGDEYWRTLDNETIKPWISINFHSNLVKLESILFRTGNPDLFPNYTVYGKNRYEEEEYITTIIPQNVEEIDSSKPVNFTIKSKYVYNSFRIEANGKRNRDDYRFVIHQLELFGSFFIFKDAIFKTCNYKTDFYIKHSMIISVFIQISSTN